MFHPRCVFDAKCGWYIVRCLCVQCPYGTLSSTKDPLCDPYATCPVLSVWLSGLGLYSRVRVDCWLWELYWILSQWVGKFQANGRCCASNVCMLPCRTELRMVCGWCSVAIFLLKGVQLNLVLLQLCAPHVIHPHVQGTPQNASCAGGVGLGWSISGWCQ